MTVKVMVGGGMSSVGVSLEWLSADMWLQKSEVTSKWWLRVTRVVMRGR